MPNQPVGEFELIERIRDRVAADASVPLGIGDDAAVIAPTPGQHLVATTDSLVLDRHFTDQWPPHDIGHLAVHVNLSDLAAMGATPRWALLSLTLPDNDAAWLDAFLDGFLAACTPSGVVLVGGNLSSGPLNITVQLLGEVAPGHAASRHGARAGDVLLVTGHLGDAAAALSLGSKAPRDLQRRLYRPEARVHAGRFLAGRAHAMIDISDGLLADLGHLLGDGLGADIRLADLPASAALTDTVPELHQRWSFQAGGGNDYELLAALSPRWLDHVEDLSAEAGIALSVIGEVTDAGRTRCLDADGQEVSGLAQGWDHFRS